MKMKRASLTRANVACGSEGSQGRMRMLGFGFVGEIVIFAALGKLDDNLIFLMTPNLLIV